jgi:hypothetical protein
MEQRLIALLDRTEIYDLVRWERFCRDQRDWQGLLDSYIPGAPVRTSWYDGDIEGFVAGSREKMEKGGSTGKHWIFPATHKVNGDRAIVESPAFIYDRLTFDGIEFDFHQYCRFFSRVVRTAEGWRLASFEGIYQRDNLQTTDPRNPLPVDWDIIKTLRPSYRFMGYTQLKRGYKLNPELIGDDRPNLLKAFYDEAQQWLRGAA